VLTILGSGFGLYGYLPAVLEWGNHGVVLPERYRETIEKRAELRRYSNRIVWVADRQSSLEAASGAIIAGRPKDQPRTLNQCLGHAHLRQIVLEKPIAPEPSTAQAVLTALIATERQVRIGYLFLLTPWHAALRSALVGGATDEAWVSISWQFMAHHFTHELDSWKRQATEGGGVIRFYAIHLIACLADCGYATVDSSNVYGPSEDAPERWEARLSGPEVPPCAVVVDSRSQKQEFQITTCARTGRAPLVVALDPFDHAAPIPPGIADQDRRVVLLIQLLQSISAADAPIYDLYRRTNDLWSEIETVSSFIRC